MKFVDTHTHIYLEQFDDDRNEMLQRSKNNGLAKLLVPDIDSHHRNKMLEVCEQNKGYCYPMLGIHPTSVKEDYKIELEQLISAIEKNNVIAIGECGLDYYWDKTYIEEQTEVLIEQFLLAQHYKLPLVIHSRKSLNELIKLLKQYQHLGLTGVFHCFPGNIKEAQEVISLGFYLGIGGVVTYKNATMAEVVKEIPIKYILLETDAPYLTPVPYRGHRNESSYIQIIANKIAELKKLTLEEVALQTTINAQQLFKIK